MLKHHQRLQNYSLQHENQLEKVGMESEENLFLFAMKYRINTSCSKKDDSDGLISVSAFRKTANCLSGATRRTSLTVINPSRDFDGADLQRLATEAFGLSVCTKERMKSWFCL